MSRLWFWNFWLKFFSWAEHGIHTCNLRLGNYSQENQEFQASLGYVTVLRSAWGCVRPYVDSGNNTSPVLLVCHRCHLSAFLIRVQCRLWTLQLLYPTLIEFSKTLWEKYNANGKAQIEIPPCFSIGASVGSSQYVLRRQNIWSFGGLLFEIIILV